MPTQSLPVTKAQILTDFMTVVYNAFNGGTSWHSGSLPSGMTESSHRLLGPATGPTPSWPTSVGDITTVNVFYILHGFAMKLTRHRYSRVWLRTDGLPSDLGFGMTSYALNQVIWFDYPAIPSQATPITAAQLNTFINALRNQVAVIRGDSNLAADMVVCHSSAPPPSCHGSRGRR